MFKKASSIFLPKNRVWKLDSVHAADFAAFVPANLYNTRDDSTNTNPELLPPNCACYFFQTKQKNQKFQT